MHISKINCKKKNGNSYSTILVQESYRTDKGPRKKTLANISHLPQNYISALEKMVDLERNGKRAKVVEDITLPAKIDKTLEGRSLQWGGIAVFLEFLKRSGLDAALNVMPFKTKNMS